MQFQNRHQTFSVILVLFWMVFYGINGYKFYKSQNSSMCNIFQEEWRNNCSPFGTDGG